MNRDFVNSSLIRSVITKYGIEDPNSFEGVNLHRYVYRIFGVGKLASDPFTTPTKKVEHPCIYSIANGYSPAVIKFYKVCNDHTYSIKGIKYLYLDFAIYHCSTMKTSKDIPIIGELNDAVLKTTKQSTSNNLYIEENIKLKKLIKKQDKFIDVLMNDSEIEQIEVPVDVIREIPQKCNKELLGFNIHVVYIFTDFNISSALQFMPDEYHENFMKSYETPEQNNDLDILTNIAFMVPISNSEYLSTISAFGTPTKKYAAKAKENVGQYLQNKPVEYSVFRNKIELFGNAEIFIIFDCPEIIANFSTEI